MSTPPSITRVLNGVAGRAAADPAIGRIYSELRAIAKRRLDREHAAPLQTTELVHEAYLKLFSHGGEWQSRAHFFGAAARAMEQLLIDAARRRGRRGGPGGPGQSPNGEVLLGDLDALPARGVDPIAASEALAELWHLDPDLAEVTRLKLFAGLSIPQLAECLGLSERTLSRRWTFARTWLYRRLLGDKTETEAQPPSERERETA
jgi:RNA polymerase sigma factor (TIGR02999 family)